MRVVLDANVLISALISPRGSPARVLAVWERGRFELLISPFGLSELDHTLRYPRLRQRYGLSEDLIREYVARVASQALLIEPSAPVAGISRDEADDNYLACATAGQASYVVSGDADLLALGSYEGIPILSPAGFLAALALLEASAAES